MDNLIEIIIENKYILVLITYYIIINLVAYITMYLDKNAAIKNKQRTSEKTLFTLALILGSLGIHLGMYKFRHKTKHINFVILIPIIFVLNIISIYYITKYIYFL